MVQLLSIFFFLDFFNFCWVFQKFPFFCVTLYYCCSYVYRTTQCACTITNIRTNSAKRTFSPVSLTSPCSMNICTQTHEFLLHTPHNSALSRHLHPNIVQPVTRLPFCLFQSFLLHFCLLLSPSCTSFFAFLLFCMCLYRVSQEECARLREGVTYVKVYRYNPKHLCRKLNGYGDNGQRKVWSSCASTHYYIPADSLTLRVASNYD